MTLEETFNSIDLATIESYVAEGKQEYVQLDFKLINRADLSHKDDRKNLVKALSGFANSEGGIIIWGVDAREQDGIDCAVGKREIDDVPLFISKLNAFTGEATSPRLNGVRHKEIITEGKKGYAATLVPESDQAPCMAKLGENRYYKRSGSSFYPMEHFDIQDMFGRRMKPKFEVTICPYSYYISQSMHRIRFSLLLKNIGRGLSRATYLELRLTGIELEENLLGLKLLEYAQGNIIKLGEDYNHVIHPKINFNATQLELHLSDQKIEQWEGFGVEYLVTAVDLPAQYGKMWVPKENIIDYIKTKTIFTIKGIGQD
jgi:hypothetical protein